MKSSWICWLIATSLLLAPAAGTAERGKGKKRPADELLNVFLSPGLAQWLVGPIARLATEEQIQAYLAITDDPEAERFVDRFWADRKPLEGVPGLTARQQFEHLAEEADRLYGEDTFPGRRTDRGTIHILYGPPDEVKYESARKAKQGELEVWRYKGEKTGLDGRAPKKTYYFAQEDDIVRFALGSERPRLLP